MMGSTILVLGGKMNCYFLATAPRASIATSPGGGFAGWLLAAIVLVAVVAAAVAVWVTSRRREGAKPRYVQLYPAGAMLWGRGPRVTIDGDALREGLRCDSAAVVTFQGRLYLRVIGGDAAMVAHAAGAVGVVTVPAEIPDAWAAAAPWEDVSGMVPVPQPGGWVLGVTAVGEAMALHPVAGTSVVVVGPEALLAMVRRGLEASWPAELFEVRGDVAGVAAGGADAENPVSAVRVAFVATDSAGAIAGGSDTELQRLSDRAGLYPTVTVVVDPLPGQSFVHHHGHAGHREFFTLWSPQNPGAGSSLAPVPHPVASAPPVRAQSGSAVPELRARHRRGNRPSPGSALLRARQEPPGSDGLAGAGRG